MFNPTEASKNIKNEFIDYILTKFHFANEKINDNFKKQLEKTISAGPFIEIQDIFKVGDTLEDLINKGVLSKRFLDLEKDKNQFTKISFPLKRELYQHQIEAINKISVRKLNAVITTGTGSGKTECFLIPIINEILKEMDEQNDEKLSPGVRAILIYPMNALANDQMKRLRVALRDYPYITFGVYNGDTKYKQNEAEAAYKDLHSNEDDEKLRVPLENELISREVMQNTPPHILCTNYAMLEQMLLRPENDTIFSNSTIKFIVLDEAHTYSGATGMEMSMLLRRLKARVALKSNPQYILTSATLGEKGNSDASIVTFAKNLCGEEFSEESLIYGQRETNKTFPEPKYFDANIFDELVSIDISDSSTVENIFNRYKIVYDKNVDIKENLYNLCLYHQLYRHIRELNKEDDDINNLFSRLPSYTPHQIIAFIHICTLASKNNRALLDAKYHFFLKAIEGIYLDLINHDLFLIRKSENGIGKNRHKIFEIGVCNKCGTYAIAGKINKDNYLEFASATNFDKEKESSITYFAIADDLNNDEQAVDDLDSSLDVLFFDPNGKDAKKEIYNLCPYCGMIVREDEGRTPCKCEGDNIKVQKVAPNSHCVNCTNGEYYRGYLQNDAATSVIATTLFEELPEKKVMEKDEEENFIERIGGKQFLVFSDNRSEAAFFAPYLGNSYKEFLRRRGIVNIINSKRQELIDEHHKLTDFFDDLYKLFYKNKTFRNSLGIKQINNNSSRIREDCKRNAWIAILNELISAKRPTSLSSLGILKFEYLGLSNKAVESFCDKYNYSDKDSMRALLNELAMSFAYFGAISTDECDELMPEDKLYIFYSSKEKYISKQRTSASTQSNGSFMAINRIGKDDEYYLNSRQKLVMRTLNLDKTQANIFLGDFFDKVLLAPNNQNKLKRGNGDGYCLTPDNFIILVNGNPNLKWYICDKCHKITSVNIGLNCPNVNCTGHLQLININNNAYQNHYFKLYNKAQLSNPLIIKEHTAQLSRERALEYQEDFEKNYINALSCSTTFEMGVDVGELETVFLRNVPPSAANYAQRAGRAGRSKNAAAYALTYAKLSSHDFNYFNNPNEMIKGKILPPIFKLNNHKIVMRHIYAVVFSSFFKKYPEFFDHNRASNFLNGGGKEKLTEYINSRPKELTSLLASSFDKNIDVEFGITSYSWVNNLIGPNGAVTLMVDDYNKTISEFKHMILDEKKKDIGEISLDNVYTRRMNTYIADKHIIELFARWNLLPKYGFPIDTVELEISSKNHASDNGLKKLQLSRDLKLAISEYAPGEKVIADNKMYTSRYIKKSLIHGKYSFIENSICQCSICNTWNFSETGSAKGKVCAACGNKLPKKWKLAINPKSGFATDGTEEPVPSKKPEKLYRNADSYIGNKNALSSYTFKCGDNKIILKSSDNDQILVSSQDFFYVCKSCGFAISASDSILSRMKLSKQIISQISSEKNTIEISEKHNTSYGAVCQNHIFEKYYLDHVYNTDVLVMEFNDPNSNYETMLSVMYALLNAMAEKLDISRQDIGGTLKSNNGQTYDIVLYDTVAGGAGNVKRLLEQDGQNLQLIFESAYQKLLKCGCSSSCYNCLRSYENQRFHDVLDRNLAIEFLKKYLGTFTKVEDDEDTAPKIHLGDDGQPITQSNLIDIILEQEDDSDVEKEEIQKVLKNLKAGLSKNNYQLPSAANLSFKFNNKHAQIDLYWNIAKVILLYEYNKEIYEQIKNSNEYQVFLLDKDLDCDAFLAAIRGE